MENVIVDVALSLVEFFLNNCQFDSIEEALESANAIGDNISTSDAARRLTEIQATIRRMSQEIEQLKALVAELTEVDVTSTDEAEEFAMSKLRYNEATGNFEF